MDHNDLRNDILMERYRFDKIDAKIDGHEAHFEPYKEHGHEH
jgi:hypothetical protein